MERYYRINEKEHQNRNGNVVILKDNTLEIIAGEEISTEGKDILGLMNVFIEENEIISLSSDYVYKRLNYKQARMAQGGYEYFVEAMGLSFSQKDNSWRNLKN